MTASTRPIRDLDVPLTRLQADLRRLLARQRMEVAAERLRWLIGHPEAATPASDGEQAECRHLFYDADPDASIPAFPYPAPKESS